MYRELKDNGKKIKCLSLNSLFVDGDGKQNDNKFNCWNFVSSQYLRYLLLKNKV